jgi:hypothetical protein
VIASAARDQRLVLAIVDNWKYYGGSDQYCAWRGIQYTGTRVLLSTPSEVAGDGA